MYLPVIGPPHADAEVGVPGTHYHYDTRFLTNQMIRRRFQIDPKDERRYPNWFAVEVVGKLETFPAHREHKDITLRTLVCIRQILEFPGIIPGNSMLKFNPARYEKALAAGDGTYPNKVTSKLEEVCAGKRINAKNPICPHRGISLASFPVDDDGCVTCPGHGLKWNLTTGEMVSRFTCKEVAR